MPNRIVFLDIDGVLVTYQSLHSGDEGGINARFCQNSVDNFNKLIKKSGAKVVVSSTWRLVMPLPQLAELLKERGLDCEFIDYTPAKLTSARGHEINMWLDDNNEDGNLDFVIIDDAMIYPPLNERQVETSLYTGFTSENLSQALKLFGLDSDS